MKGATETPQHTASTLVELVERGGAAIEGDAPSWLRDARAMAIERAAAIGLPAKTDEEWRYTDPKPLLEGQFSLPRPGAHEGDDPCEHMEIEASARIVFIDGRLAPEHCRLSGLPSGVEVSLVGTGEEADVEERLAPIVAQGIGGARDGLEALGAGLITGGVFVRVDAGVTLEKPIVVVFRAEDGSPVLSAPHITLIVGEGARASVIEDHQGSAGATGLTLGRSEVRVAKGAHAEHAMLQREAPGRHHVSTLRLIQDAESHFHSDRILLGGAVTRNNIHATLQGESCEAVFNGLYTPEERQHHDSHIRVEHMAPGCNSRQYYRGILADRSRAVFTGRIYVKDVAQQTDAIQSNSNLLLSDAAQAVAKPQLEIYADDVRCTHGATSGQLDADAEFYLRARGVPERVAKLLLLQAFAGENIDRIENEALRSTVHALADDRLGAALERNA